jgi:hypothetical protein
MGTNYLESLAYGFLKERERIKMEGNDRFS